MIESFKVCGHTVEIHQDEDAALPEILNTITYNAGSRHVLGTVGVTTEEFERIGAKIASGEYVGMPVWAYVHSGLQVQASETNPFSCPWDSGRSGWVYCTKEQALREFGGSSAKRMSKRIKGAALGLLKAEVEQFSCYLNGEVYGYVIKDESGEQVEACWGFYGLAECRGEASSAALDLTFPMAST